MSYLGAIAAQHPDRLAIVTAGGDDLTYAELDARSNRLAHLFRGWGLQPGDGIAVLLGNEARFAEVYWAAMRTGLYFTPVNWHLTPGEAAYVVDNSDARVLLASDALRDVAGVVAENAPKVDHRVLVGDGALPGFARLDEVTAGLPSTPVEHELEGSTMLYSSGTTGMPKGVRQPLPGTKAGEGLSTGIVLSYLFGMSEGDRYLCPGPLYHAAPLQFSMAQHRIGATVVLMDRFDPEAALVHIERFRVTTSQWVPTMFNRMLKLPEPVRGRYDLSSHRLAIHAAAPCPIPVKRAMIEWWGPIIIEYYAGTEGGGTLIGSDEWLAHPGSVGRHWSGRTVHVLGEDAKELPAGAQGAIYFDAADAPTGAFSYHKDEAKTAASYRGSLYTLGDIGYVDEDGYLFLTDRRSNMIISGGVNVYPQEVENHLIAHPQVADCAVIGVPDDDLGEAVKAVVQLLPGITPSDALAGELQAYCRDALAAFKSPRSIDFVTDLPRQANGKLYKRLLRDQYWKDRESRLV